MPSNGDTLKVFSVGKDNVRGLGSFHKTLPHNDFGEVDSVAFEALVNASAGNGSGFATVPLGAADAAPLTNPQAGLAADALTQHPAAYAMPPAPTVLSESTAAEMTELYWMALLRDLPFNEWTGHADVIAAAAELDTRFKQAAANGSDPAALRAGRDLPGADGAVPSITPANLFRLGLPGEETGPMLSQFFVRPVAYGTQTIDVRQRPYATGADYLVDFPSWLDAQKRGRDAAGQDYGRANEDVAARFEAADRYVSTMRDLARFVNKDALHQAYFNGALLMLSGGAAWTPGSPYASGARLSAREAGFGVLGGPHIIALVAEVATRALKVVWNQKWQVNLRLRPEAYGGLLHVQEIGVVVTTVGKTTRAYGLPSWLPTTAAATEIRKRHGGLLLPMAFTPGSPAHPAYGAGHATVAGACVTMLKAFFRTLNDSGAPLPFDSLLERSEPYGPKVPMTAYLTGRDAGGAWQRFPHPTSGLTIEGELNKLTQNVAMGRSMGGVHWRSDNSRSLLLGEAIAAEMLAHITTDANEHPAFLFRSFARKSSGEPKIVEVRGGRVYVDGALHGTHFSQV
jgi:hypothetical protein